MSVKDVQCLYGSVPLWVYADISTNGKDMQRDSFFKRCVVEKWDKNLSSGKCSGTALYSKSVIDWGRTLGGSE